MPQEQAKEWDPYSPVERLEELIRDVRAVRTVIDGVRQIAEQNSAGCDTDWLAVLYSLETQVEMLDIAVERATSKGGQER